MSDVHRHHPEASPEEIAAIQAAQLLGIHAAQNYTGTEPEGERIERTCRECAGTFTIPAEHADKHGKWYDTCAFCLVGEM